MQSMENTGFTLDANTHAADLKDALGDFVSGLKAFQKDIETRVSKQEERNTMLERKSIAVSRPHLTRAFEGDKLHQKAFEAYVRSGEDDALRGLDYEAKGLSTAVNSDGGYLVDPQTSDLIHATLKGASSLRSIANVVQVEASSYDLLVDHADIGAGWASESGGLSETGTPQIDRISIPLHELSALPKASQRLLDDSAFDIEGWLSERIADKFSRSEGAAFVSGDGVDKPKGFLSYPTVATGKEVWGKIGYVLSGESGDFSQTEPADGLIDLVYALGAQYRARAHFVMNSKTAGKVRKLKDSEGRFIWADSLAEAQPARLLGYPVLISEDMPDIEAGATAIAFGDFSAGYTIAERPDLRVLRDPFSAKPHVLFYATKRVGGDVSDFSAIKLLKFAAA